MIVGTLVGGSFSVLSMNKDYPTGTIMIAALVFSPACVVIHELGHAWAASLLGGHVYNIQLGKPRTGMTPFRLSFFGYNWLLYAVPFCGLVRGQFVSTRHFRLRQCLFIAGGPFLNALCLAGAWLMADQTQSPSAVALWVGLLFANGIILLTSVPPRKLPAGSIASANDGMLFYETLRYSDEEVRRLVELGQMTSRYHEKSRQLEGASLTELLAKYDAGSESLLVLWQITNRLHQANDGRYPKFALKLIDHPKLESRFVSKILDEYLTWQLNRGAPFDADTLDRLSLKMLALENCTSTQGTRGAVLVEIGRFKEGQAVLQGVLAKTTSSIDRTYSNVFLALAAEAEGNLSLARMHAATAAKLDPGSPVIGRISRLLDDGSPTRLP